METLKDVLTRMQQQHLERQAKRDADKDTSQNSENFIPASK